MAERRVRPFLLNFAGALALLLLAGAAALWGVQRYVAGRLAPDATTIATASLAGLREQNRLSAFAARYVAVVTSRQSRLGLSAERTTIMPGSVSYEVDLGRLTQRDVTWDAATNTLSVTLPPVEVTAPAIDLAAIRTYGSGGILARLTDAEAVLDEANRRAGQRELIAQARAPTPMNLARDATRRAVARSFAFPLRAAGLEATVQVRFADEGRRSTEEWDRSRSLREVLGEAK